MPEPGLEPILAQHLPRRATPDVVIEPMQRSAQHAKTLWASDRFNPALGDRVSGKHNGCHPHYWRSPIPGPERVQRRSEYLMKFHEN
jgi:hypothetical protein